jgi:hypothetical protein
MPDFTKHTLVLDEIKLFSAIEAKMLLAIKLLQKPDEKINFFTAIEAKMILAIKLLQKPD